MAKLINELLLLTCMGGFIASDNLVDLMKDFSLSAIPASVAFSMRARGSASTSAQHASPVGSCGCNHERRSTASRAWSIARNRVAISGNVQSSRTKFGRSMTAILASRANRYTRNNYTLVRLSHPCR